MRVLNQKNGTLKREKYDRYENIKVYIIPEGDKTEILYFTGIKYNRISFNIKPILDLYLVANDNQEAGQSHPKRKLDNFLNSIVILLVCIVAYRTINYFSLIITGNLDFNLHNYLASIYKSIILNVIYCLALNPIVNFIKRRKKKSYLF